MCLDILKIEKNVCLCGHHVIVCYRAKCVKNSNFYAQKDTKLAILIVFVQNHYSKRIEKSEFARMR